MVSVAGSQVRGSLPDMPWSPGQIITLPVGNKCEWTGKKGKGLGLAVLHSPTTDCCATPGRAPKDTPITTATMRLNATRWCSLGLVFIAIGRLASLPAESHINFA